VVQLVTRPTIAVTGPVRGGTAAWWCIAALLRLAGARPIRITPNGDRSLDGAEALVVTGGADVDPRAYGQTPRGASDLSRGGAEAGLTLLQRVARITALPAIYLGRRLFSVKRMLAGDPDRDALERRLIETALQRNLPVLGICRGAQLLNVVRGGTLHQELGDFYAEVAEPQSLLPRKRVTVEAGSRLATVTGPETMVVNGLHHQAVDRLGEGLRIVARAASGVVQAIEDPSRPLVIGVQWHPEYLPYARRQRALFHALVAAAATRRPADHGIHENGA
jgi:putative glutamine amidotransferase